MQTNQEHLVKLRKAAWGYDDMVSGGGAMEQGYAREMVALTVKKSVALQDMLVFGTQAQSYKIPNIKFSGQVLWPGTPGQALPDAYHSTPTVGKVEYTAKLYKAKVGIDDETLEDNVEEAKLRNKVQGLIADAVKADMEWVVFEGDTTSSNPTLAVQNGLFAQATSHEKDAGGAVLSYTIMKAAFKLLPSEFRFRKSEMRTWAGANAVEDFYDENMDLQTPLGDAAKQGNWDGPWFKKMPVMDVPKIAEDLGMSSNYTHGLMTHPKNATVGVWKQIKMEPERDADAGIWNLIVRIRFGIAWAEENGVVEISNLAT